LLSALADLRNTQNNFMSVWLNHYAVRMSLYRDLGIMELDDRGMWIDRPLREYLAEISEIPCLPPDVPEQWLIEAGVPRLPATDGSDANPPAPTGVEGGPVIPPQGNVPPALPPSAQPMPGPAPLQVRGPSPYAR
jgi:hypothetical protein